MLDDAKKRKACLELDRLVSDFNERFAQWSKNHGCVVNFGWAYGHDGQKRLETQSIDMIIYRKDAPRPADLAAVMKQYEPKPDE